jgi:tetratricopeptide (TPR) repeat protein
LGASFLLAALLFQAAPTVPNEDLQRGKNAYDRGEFARAVEIIRPLLYPEIRLQSEGQIVQAHRILGVAYLFEKDEAEATHEFRKMLQLTPDYHFDPLLDPPEVVDFFNNVRKGYEAELGDLEARRKAMDQARQRDKEECDKVRAGPTVVERRVGRNSFTTNFIPFGAGQFQNGQRTKGWAFLVSESVLGAVSIGAFATNLAVYGFRPQRACRYDVGSTACPADAIDHTDENRSRWLTRVQVASGAMFFGAVALGVIDALYFYTPETQLAFAPAPRRQTTAGTLRLSPAVMDRAIGPGLSFRF